MNHFLQDYYASLIVQNQREYEEKANQIKWISQEQISIFEEQRQKLIDRILAAGGVWGSHETKIDQRTIAPGCRICIEGRWSCLFINNRCNCHCFYCPASQHEAGDPSTNALSFNESKDYVAYLEAMKFKGASISGGEPLMTPDKTLSFIKAIKSHFGHNMHVWMYTNGTLLSEQIVNQLKEAGLDEIRFDIGADNYSLEKVKLAVRIIPVVTIEVPAVFEEVERMKNLMGDMKNAGVDYLNLHQLRLTPYNFDHLTRRNYTFLHGEKVTVLESELAALDLIAFSLEQQLNLPVNYCSFIYKNRHQKAAARMISAPWIMNDYDEMTDNGFIRRIYVQHQEKVDVVKIEPSQTKGNRKFGEKKFFISSKQLDDKNLVHNGIYLEYSRPLLRQHLSYYFPFKEIKLNNEYRIVAEKVKMGDGLYIPFERIKDFQLLLNENFNPAQMRFGGLNEKIILFERVIWGLQPYY